jgi:plasmid stabilization system protein ParE
MGIKKLKVIWTLTAKNQLKGIYNFYKNKSEKVAKNIKTEILSATKNIVFSEQFQQDEIEPSYRRII